VTNEASKTPHFPFHGSRDYLLLVTAQGISLTGREIESLVLPLLVLALTGSPSQVGLIAAAQSLPYLVLSLAAGALVDRWDRKIVMIVCDGVRALAFASLPIAWLFGGPHLTQLYVVAVIAGSAFVFYNIAEISSLPLVVNRSELTRATSVNTVVEWVGETAGPALGGVLTGLRRSTLAGAMLGYSVQAVMMGVSLLFLGAIRQPLRAARVAQSRQPLLAEIREGMAWLFAHPQIRAMAVLAMALSLFFSPVSLAVIVLARGEFHSPPASIGLMFSVGAIAGLASTVAAPWIRARLSVGRIVLADVAIWAGCLAAVASAGSIVALGAAWLIVSAVSGVHAVTSISYRLALIPSDMQGRVNSVFRFLAWGLRPAALALGGLAISAIGPRETLWILAGGMSLTAAAVLAGPLRKAR
jgi:hypothetical protein